MGEYHGLREIWLKLLVLVALYLGFKLGFASEVWVTNLWECFGELIVAYILSSIFEFNAGQVKNLLGKALLIIAYLVCEGLKLFIIYMVIVNLKFVLDIEGNDYWFGPYIALWVLLIGQIVIYLVGITSAIFSKIRK